MEDQHRDHHMMTDTTIRYSEAGNTQMLAASFCYFKEIKIERESDLRAMLANNPNAIEEGLGVLKQEYPTESGPVDLLCVDYEGRLCIGEIKLGEDNIMLLQALRYYDWVYSNRDRIDEMFRNNRIDISKEPKIILIARDFSETLIKSAKYVEPRVDLYTYKYLQTSTTGERGLLLIPVTVEEPEAPPEPFPTLEDYKNHVTDPDVNKILEEFLGKLQNMSEGIRLNPTKNFISVYYLGKRMSVIQTRRTFFNVYLTRGSEWTDKTRIEKEEDYRGIYLKIGNFHKELSMIRS